MVPEFKAKLDDVTVPEHDDATFTCKLNDEELEVDWYFKDKKVSGPKINFRV